jgi:N-methylhydantoinase B/acetone carboxylase alpha subunit
MILDAIKKFIDEEGLDYYKRFIREIIEEGRGIFIKRIKERLIPGRYRAVQFSEVPFKDKHWNKKAQKNILMHAPMEIEISSDGKFKLSFDGASSPGRHAFNCTESAMQGGLWVLLSQVLTYDGRVNDGSYLAMEYYFP